MGQGVSTEHALAAPELPADLADVLHLLDSRTDDWHWLAWTLCFVSATVLLAWLGRRRRRPSSAPAARRPPSASPVAASGLAAKIDRLRADVLINGQFRQGCHRLAALLRQQGEQVETQPMTRWTSGEIAQFLGDVPMSRVMGLVAELQFSRQEPLQGDFEGVCELAREAADGRRW